MTTVILIIVLLLLTAAVGVMAWVLYKMREEQTRINSAMMIVAQAAENAAGARQMLGDIDDNLQRTFNSLFDTLRKIPPDVAAHLMSNVMETWVKSLPRPSEPLVLPPHDSQEPPGGQQQYDHTGDQPPFWHPGEDPHPNQHELEAAVLEQPGYDDGDHRIQPDAGVPVWNRPDDDDGDLSVFREAKDATGAFRLRGGTDELPIIRPRTDEDEDPQR